jgi:four helix bundle protein
MPKDMVGRHFAGQLVRSATAPAAHYAEACSAESRKDFIHTMQVALRELREAAIWIRFVQELGRQTNDNTRLAKECGELVAIVIASVNTAKVRREKTADNEELPGSRNHRRTDGIANSRLPIANRQFPCPSP